MQTVRQNVSVRCTDRACPDQTLHLIFHEHQLDTFLTLPEGFKICTSPTDPQCQKISTITCKFNTPLWYHSEYCIFALQFSDISYCSLHTVITDVQGLLFPHIKMSSLLNIHAS